MGKTGWNDASKKWPPGIGAYLIVVDGVVVCATWMGGGIWLLDGRAVDASHWQALPDPPVQEVEHAVYDS